MNSQLAHVTLAADGWIACDALHHTVVIFLIGEHAWLGNQLTRILLLTVDVERLSLVDVDAGGERCAQFEIIGVDSTDFSEELGIAPIGEDWIRRYKQAGGTGHMTANMRNLVLTVDGKLKISYARILIRKKQ